MNVTEAYPQPFFDDPCEIFQRLSSLGDAVLLDSGANERGRFDIVAAQADPLRSVNIPASTSATALTRKLHDWSRAAAALSAETSSADAAELPFHGGYIGQASYELGRRLQGLSARSDSSLPLATLNYYPWAIVQDRQRSVSWLVGDTGADPSLRRQIDQLLQAGAPAGGSEPFRLNGAFEARWSLDEYRDVFQRVKHYIADGDCYQINIGQPFSAPFSGSLFGAYRHLRRIACAPFSAYFPLPDGSVLMSLSPERFLTVHNGCVETRPIKGTRPRYQDPLKDRAAARALLESDKERAENLMIVDMLRNDIGRFCSAGSVRADALFELESYATVHHLVSTVRGRLAPGHSASELLLGCLPGGSITGAPKRRAMEIIDELEPAGRQAWCGSIFYLSQSGTMDSNIAIRTLYNEGDRLHCWAGGGLVDDSRAEDEFQEQQHKVGAFLRALENL